MRNSRARPATVLFLSWALTPLACYGPATDEPPLAGRLESAGASPDTLRAEVLSVSFDGELCPPSLANGSSSSEHVVVNEEGLLDAQSAMGVSSSSSEPSCTISIEANVPAGFKMGAPSVRWLGFVYGSNVPISVSRSYSFEGGESASPAPTDVPSEFTVLDSSLPAFSPSCSEQRVRLTARFQARGLDPATMSITLSNAHLLFSWRLGTEFQECVPGTYGDPSAGAEGEWCEGVPHRPCLAHLACELGRFGAARDEGTCVDPEASPPPAGYRRFCGGPRNIACEEGLVCWHASQSDVDRSFVGTCQESPLGHYGSTNAFCDFGVPAIACKNGLYCNEQNLCVNATGAEGEPCNEPGLPECQSPLECVVTPDTWKRRSVCATPTPEE